MIQKTSEHIPHPSRVTVLATGGTIAGQASLPGSVANYQPGVLQAEDLLKAVPGLADSAAINCRQVANLGSEDMDPSVWLALAAAVREEMANPEVTGIVVLHGTDTMEETACFLDLCVLGNEETIKPVVMTGAMRPADAVSADGPANILGAVRTAISPNAAGRGVLVVFNGKIHAARRVYKADSLNLDAFASTVGGCEGLLLDGTPFFLQSAGRPPVQASFDIAECEDLPRVEIIYGHAGQRRELVDAALATGAWGVVHAGVGMGNIHAAVRPVLAEAAAGGTVVVCASRVPEGASVRTERNRKDRFVSAGPLNPQKARVLLQLALTETDDFTVIQSMFDSYQ